MIISKLAYAKRPVIDRINEGWALGFSTGLEPRAWWQPHGVRLGGRSEDVHLNAFVLLQRLGLIKAVGWEFPSPTYVLVEPQGG